MVAYAKAVEEILPDCMQIVDRFHLHQNLLESVKNTVNVSVPVDVKKTVDHKKTFDQAGSNTEEVIASMEKDKNL